MGQIQNLEPGLVFTGNQSKCFSDNVSQSRSRWQLQLLDLSTKAIPLTKSISQQPLHEQSHPKGLVAKSNRFGTRHFYPCNSLGTPIILIILAVPTKSILVCSPEKLHSFHTQEPPITESSPCQEGKNSTVFRICTASPNSKRSKRTLAEFCINCINT